MKRYKIIDIMGDFSLLVNSTIKADSDEEVKKIIMESIKNNIDKYLYPVVEVEDEI